jgi:NAD(P)-dependent dehydrogenase (short-subunit alcohol dehydrogenase family)
MKDLKDKVAVVTGGASGIGRATALALARRGAHVAVADLHEARGRQTAQDLEALGVRALFQRCDVSRDEEVGRLRQATLDRFGRVDVLMNNVGVLPVGAFDEVGMDAWERTFQVNLFSYVRCTQAFLPELSANGEGHVVNTASMAGLLAYDPKSLAYGASKAAVISLSEGLVLALRPRNIGVTCLCPGGVTTNIREQISAHGDTAFLGEYCRRFVASREASDVGEMVVSAILENRFLLHTDDSVQEILLRRAQDPEGFLREMGDFIGSLA